MKITENYVCIDEYEKEKLSLLFSEQKDEAIFVYDVENIIDNEIIILLRDRSAHSVTMEDKKFAEMLFILIKDIKNKKRRFVEVQNSGPRMLTMVSELWK